MRDSKAALDLLFRRTKRLADYETETKNLDKARQKHKDEKQAEQAQQDAKQKFENISDIARNGTTLTLFPSSYSNSLTIFYCFIELSDFKVRRNAMFKKSLTEFVELQIKHSNVSI
jgi:sorting nexin-5/6/32